MKEKSKENFLNKMSAPKQKKNTVRKDKEKCYVCNKSVANLVTHLKTHSPRSRNPYVCHYCPSVFQTEELQSIHVQAHDELTCPICSEWLHISRYDHHYKNCQRDQEKSSKNTNLLKTPNKSHSTIPNSEVIFCDICQIEWMATDPEGLQDHIEQNHQEGGYDTSELKVMFDNLEKTTEAKKPVVSNKSIDKKTKVRESKKTDIGKPKPTKITKTPKWKEEIKKLKENNVLLNNMYDTSEATNSKIRTESEKQLNTANKCNEVEQKNLKHKLSCMNTKYERIKGKCDAISTELSSLKADNSEIKMELKKEKAKNTSGKKDFARNTSEEPTKQESKAVQVENVQSEAILENSQSNEPLIKIDYKCQLCKFETLEKTDLVSHMVTGHKVDETQTNWNKYVSFCKRGVTIPKNIPNFEKTNVTTDTKQNVSNKIMVEETKLTSQKSDQASMNKDEAKTKEKPTSDGNSIDSVQLEIIQAASLPLAIKCSECKKTFSQKWLLNRHIESVHEGKKPFQCNHCEKQFSQKPAMEKHVESVHEGKKEFKCKECDKNFTQSSNMKMHIAAVHEKKKPHTCEICDAKFPNRQSLSNHKAYKHSNEKPFKCSICNKKSFSLQKGLNRHITKCTLITVVHEKKKTFMCTSCPKVFGRKEDLKTHEKTCNQILSLFEPNI